MPTTREEIDSFSRFAKEILERSAEALSMEELIDLWRIENPNPKQLSEDVLAVRTAISDFNAGDRGVPVEQQLGELRAKYKLFDK